MRKRYSLPSNNQNGVNAGLFFLVVITVLLTFAFCHRMGHAEGEFIAFSNESTGLSISADNNIVVGQMTVGGRSHAFRWTRSAGVMTDLRPGTHSSEACGVSADGGMMAGGFDGGSGGSTRAYRLSTADNVMQDLGVLPGAVMSTATGISGDGKAVAGWSYFTSLSASHAFRWNEPGGSMEDLGTLGGTNSYAQGISGDGRTLVGFSNDAAGHTHAFRWTEAGGSMEDLGTLGGASSYAQGISGDGRTVVGYSSLPTTPVLYNTFRWTEEGGMEDLGRLKDVTYSSALAVSADGSVIAGYGNKGSTDNVAFRWSRTTGIETITDWLAAHGVDAAGLAPAFAYAVSPDGSTIVGTMSDSMGFYARVVPVLTVRKSGMGTVVSAPEGINCGAVCRRAYNSGTVITLTATADDGFAFKEWAGCPSPDGASCVLTLTADRDITVTASFLRTAVLSIATTGAGTVASTPEGILCGSACSRAFFAGQEITLTAATPGNQDFDYWSGACDYSGTLPRCHLTLTEDMTVGAVFVPGKTKKLRLNVARSRMSGGDGIISSHDLTINCGTACRNTYYKNTPITLTAIPKATAKGDSTFTGWRPLSLRCPATGDCRVPIDKAKTVSAVFVGPQKLTVLKQRAPKSDGTITSGSVAGAPLDINCGPVCTAYYPLHSRVILTGAGSANSIFLGWMVNSTMHYSQTYTVSMDSARLIIAVFAKKGP